MLTAREYLDEEKEMYKLPPALAKLPPIRWGHSLMDRAIPGGIPIHSPGFHLIQGPSGARKTTFVLNKVMDMHLSTSIPKGFTTFWWSVEQFMTQEHVFSMLQAMLATKIIIYNRFHPESNWNYLLGLFGPDFSPEFVSSMSVSQYFEECFLVKERVHWLFSDGGIIPHEAMGTPDPIVAIREIGKDAVMTAQFIKSMHRWPKDYTLTPEMLNGYRVANHCLMTMRVKVFGSSEHANEDLRELRSFPSDNLNLSQQKWMELAKYANGNCQFVIDHVTAFETGGSDYEKQRAFKPFLKRIVAEYPILFWVIIQDGVGNQRDYERYGRVLGSSGGDVLKQESTVNWRKRFYDREKHLYWDVLERPEKTRIGDHPSLAFMLAPYSGAYIGEAQLASKVIP